MNFLNYAGIAATFAIVAGFWRNILNFIRRCSGLFIVSVILKDDATKAVLMYAWKNRVQSPFGMRMFSGAKTFLRPLGRVGVVAFEEVPNDPMLVRFNRSFILIQRTSTHFTQKNSVGDVQDWNTVATIVAIRGTLDIEQFIEFCIAKFNHKGNSSNCDRKRFTVHRISRNWHPVAASNLPSQMTPLPSNLRPIQERVEEGIVRLLSASVHDITECSSDTSPFSLYPFPAETMDLLTQAQRWIDHQEFFVSRGIPWRYGWLLHGPPGTGKSTFARSIAITLDLPLFVFDLSTMDNNSFPEEWRDMQSRAPAIALIEDIDAVFEGRKNVAESTRDQPRLTFDCLLNTISGVGVSDGVLLIITTNHIESLDPALGIPSSGTLSSRPGRIDRIVFFGPMHENQRRTIASTILDQIPDAERESIIHAGEGESAAQFQSRCADAAIQHFWGRGEGA